MATIKTANTIGKYRDPDAKEDVIAYILNPYKTPHGFVGGIHVSALNPAESMQIVSESFHKGAGVQLRHYIISFDPLELTSPASANGIAREITAMIGQEYQTVFAVHENTAHLHIHVVFNSVSYVDGHRWHGTRAEFNRQMNGIRAALSKAKPGYHAPNGA